MSLEYKGYNIINNNFSNKVIKAIGKGSVGMELRGLFTSSGEAMKAIDSLVAKQLLKKGVTKNVTAKDSSRNI
jgi:hypothetical protein